MKGVCKLHCWFIKKNRKIWIYETANQKNIVLGKLPQFLNFCFLGLPFRVRSEQNSMTFEYCEVAYLTQHWDTDKGLEVTKGQPLFF